jgi:hypothetical protein
MLFAGAMGVVTGEEPEAAFAIAPAVIVRTAADRAGIVSGEPLDAGIGV